MSVLLPQTASRRTAILLAVLCLTGLLVYAPGLSGEFTFDDIANITKNYHIHMEQLSAEALKTAVFSSPSGPLGRPVSMLSFALNYYFTGLDPFYYKLTNLIIHLLNGLGLFFLTRLILEVYRRHAEPRLTDTHILFTSLAVSAAWVLHPLNLTGVLYVVQRMTSLSALFVIWGLVCYVAGRRRLNDGRPGLALVLTGLLVFTPLAVLSKENGALLPVFMLAIELIIFRFDTPRSWQRRFIYALFGLSIVVPAAILAAYTVDNPQWLMGSYLIREFTLYERILTESRVLWFYLKLILAPTASQLGLFHDDYPISHSLLDPYSTLPAVVGLVLLLSVAYWSRRRAPLLALGVLWFFVGHSVESTVLPLELVHEHRNYLPQYGILLAVVYYLLYPFAFTQILRGRQALTAAFIVLLGVGTVVRASDWGNPALLGVIEVAHHPDSPRANHNVGVIYTALANAAQSPEDKDKYYNLALEHFEKSGRLGGNNVDSLLASVLLLDALKRPTDQAVDSLVDKLRHEPFAHNTANDLTNLVKCEENNDCKLPLSVVGRIFQASLDNPTLTGRPRTLVLMAAGEHLINEVGNYRDALDMFQEAVQIMPRSLINRLNFAKALIAGRRYNEARKQLTALKSLDSWGIYSRQVAEQEQLLAQAQSRIQTQRAPLSKPTAAVTPRDTAGDDHGA
jgi:hypothetical protein